MAKGPLSSLRNRVFLACAAVSVLALAFALQFVTALATRNAEAQVKHALDDAAFLVGRSYASRAEALSTTARLIADLPLLKALVATDADTVTPVARDYAARIKAPLLAFANRDGRVLAVVGPEAAAGVESSAVREALSGRESWHFRSGPSALLQVLTVPMAFRTEPPTVEGALAVGLALDESLARELRGVTESEVAFIAEGRVLASSLAGADAKALVPALGEATGEVVVGGNEYIGLSRPLAGPEGPRFVVLRSRTERLRFLEPLKTALLAAAAAAVLGAVLLSYLVSRTVTRPLAEITSAMREIARTGDFTRKLPPRTSYDEDARVLGSAFDTLLDSVVRFQREAAEKERLSALGRLSTVIAHEVRNPLMIIKASLRGLGKPAASPDQVAEAAQDIDHEVARLNRIVGDVLDFARPPRLDIQPTDLHAVCRDAAAAGLLGEAGPRLKLELGFTGETLLTDAERLRTALVNILGNAREAVAAKRSAPEGAAEPAAEGRNGFDIELSTGPGPDGGAWVRVRDRGVGIAAADLPHVFEPYFTTKRTGTGLGLAIARNIVLSLGGRIDVRSEDKGGTEIAIELPRAAPGAPPSGAAA